MNNTLLKLANLSVQYDRSSKLVVNNVSFELQRQTINVLIGPNGSGKSSLIKAILGLVPTQGVVTFFNSEGLEVARESIHIGYVSQRLELDTTVPVTVNEFLQLTLSSCRRLNGAKKNEVARVLRDVSILGLRNKKLGSLSGGQLQRVILARALLHYPQLLILDEPEAGIDVSGEHLFYELLKKLVKEQQVTVLIASHELEIVHKYADNVLCINGKLVCNGSVKKALTTKNFVKLYGIDKRILYGK